MSLKNEAAPPFLKVCLLRLVVSSSQIVFWALTACQTCASHDGEDFQPAGNEIRRRDGFHMFSHSSVSWDLPQSDIGCRGSRLCAESHPRGAWRRGFTLLLNQHRAYLFFWQQDCLISLVIMCWHQVDNMWVCYRSNGGGLIFKTDTAGRHEDPQTGGQDRQVDRTDRWREQSQTFRNSETRSSAAQARGTTGLGSQQTENQS